MRIRIGGKPPWRRAVWGGLALVLVVAVAGCAGLYQYADPPRVTLAGIRILDLNLFEQRYQLALRVQNPNRFDLPIERMSYTLEVNGSEFAHGVNNQKNTIPALGE
ncbi:LEA type 2 family protein, partial [Nitrococcus mobilis]